MPDVLLETQPDPRVLLKGLWTPRLSSSSDSDGNRCLVRGGVDDLLSRNRHRYSPRIEDVESTGRDLARVLRGASFRGVVSYVTVIKRPSGNLGKGNGSDADLLPALKTIWNCGTMAGGGIAASKT